MSPASSKKRIYPANTLQRVPDEPICIVIDSTGLKVYGEGEWKVKKHKADKRHTWRKLHLAVNEVHAIELTTSDADMIKPLLVKIIHPIARLSGHGAYYNQMKVCKAYGTDSR